MYFTRDPVIETVITSREGYKLSIRNSKHLSQDPFVVEAIEVICLGGTSFFRNCDHCKPFWFLQRIMKLQKFAMLKLI